MHFAVFCYIFPTNAQYINNICFLKHWYMFRYLRIVFKDSIIIYANATNYLVMLNFTVNNKKLPEDHV